MSLLLERVRRILLFVVPGYFIVKTAGFVLAVVLARRLSVREYGVYSLILGTLVYFRLLTDLGVTSSLQRFIPEYWAKKEHERISATYRFTSLFRLFLSLLFFGLAIFAFEPIARIFKIEGYRLPFIVFCASATILIQIEVLTVLFNGLFLHAYRVSLETAYTVLKTVLIVCFVVLGYGVTGIFWGELGAYVPAFVVFLFLYHRYKTRVSPRRERGTGRGKIEGKRLLRFSFFNALARPGRIIYDVSTDYLIISHYLQLHDVGLYSFASRTTNMIHSVIPQSILQSVIRPVFYVRTAREEDRRQSLQQMFNTLNRMNFFFLFPIWVFLLLEADTFISLVFDPKFHDASLVLVVTFFFVAFGFFRLPSDLVIQAVEKVEVHLYVQVFALYNLVFDIVVLKLGWGILGVAFVTGTATLFHNLLLYRYARTFTGISFEWRGLGLICLNGSLMGIGIAVVSRFLEGWPELIGSFLTGSFLYLLLSFRLRPFSSYETALLRSLIRRKPASPPESAP